MTEKIIVDEKTMLRTMQRLSHEIIEQNPGAEALYLVGIKRRGVPIAQRIGANIELFSDIRVATGELDITWYRDDLRKRYGDPKINEAHIGFDVAGKHIILVDDVLYTGRTARAAMEALIALGRPDRVQLLVMIDRGHRELPISANYVGKNIPTAQDEVVKVRVPEFDGKMEVVLQKRDDS
ncbi:MAG: bifunctional pyr operon transcriptional regulator/uracil phosphoribosyltransferase PyrR [Lachnospiraceae bacterium]|nr:bifunctional pyr operon transcriptional regulator/uracil phosphoribosyltransferase PyrR [Lachnospiraceae bacterium]